MPAPYPGPSQEAPENLPEISRELRHDIRGLLSPAVLRADQLSTHPDESVRTKAEQILEALDRITERIQSARS